MRLQAALPQQALDIPPDQAQQAAEFFLRYQPFSNPDPLFDPDQMGRRVESRLETVGGQNPG